MIEISTFGELTIVAVYYTPAVYGKVCKFGKGQDIETYLGIELDALDKYSLSFEKLPLQSI